MDNFQGRGRKYDSLALGFTEIWCLDPFSIVAAMPREGQGRKGSGKQMDCSDKPGANFHNENKKSRKPVDHGFLWMRQINLETLGFYEAGEMALEQGPSTAGL